MDLDGHRTPDSHGRTRRTAPTQRICIGTPVVMNAAQAVLCRNGLSGIADSEKGNQTSASAGGRGSPPLHREF